MSHKNLFASFVLGLALICAGSGSLFAASATSLQGTWQLMYAPTNPVEAANIPGLATCSIDGLVVESDGAEAAPGSYSGGSATTYGTAGHGYWVTGNSSGTFVIQFQTLNVNADGSLKTTRTTTATLTFSNSNGAPSLSGTYTSTITAPDGAGPVTQTGSLTATLMPMPAR